MLNPRRQTFVLKLAITNADRRPLDWTAAATGVGGVFRHREATERTRATWFYHCFSEAAETVLIQIRPYLKIKQAQADLAISVQERVRQPALKADRTWQQEAITQMKTLNKRGPREEG